MKRKSTMAIGMVVFCFMVMATGVVWSIPGVPNGTVTDGNLVWLQDADSYGKLPWDQAASSVGNLASGSHGLSDGSKAGQWRLPTKSELEGRVKNVTGFTNVSSEFYWSSDSVGSQAWAVSANYKTGLADKPNPNHVWPVRSR